MDSWDDRNGSPRGQERPGPRRDVARALFERERGRRRLNAATATVGFASVVAAGAVAAVLPGSTHASATTSGSSSTPVGASASTGGHASSGNASNAGSTSSSGSNSQSSGSSSSSSTSSNNSGNLQAPTYTPVQSNGGGQSTSGGTNGW